ncbi:transporter [Neisseria arctica]|uniref:Transporter n=1 Tax=Neisseria arctica TaxID=1470200 RepID=A0A0J0YU66_9NEIS|nr:AEC family transporter [Neisseria arctica]KLT73640.1 transporter [Neisseria arctica]UOO85766.1 AEC family transporter [Neisseria arctica]
MLAVLTITAPIFVVMAMGFFAVRFEMFTESQLAALGKFVIRIGLPMLVFHAIATRPIADVFSPIYLAGYGMASLLAFVVGWAASRYRGQEAVLSALNGLATGMSNTGFIGYPLAVMALGNSAGIYFAMNVLIENILILPLMFVLIDLAKGSEKVGATLRRLAINLLKNPIILALLIGLFFSVSAIPVPAVLERVSAMLASAASPLALFVIGGGLVGLSVQGNLKDILPVVIGKLLVFPLLVVACLWGFGASKEIMFAGALLASVPMASMYPIFGRQYGFARQTAAVMLLTTVISFFSISLVLLLGHG